MNNATKSFCILAISLSVLHNYLTNFSDLYLAKILDLSVKSFFPGSYTIFDPVRTFDHTNHLLLVFCRLKPFQRGSNFSEHAILFYSLLRIAPTERTDLRCIAVVFAAISLSR